jgi:hypothetical protein
MRTLLLLFCAFLAIFVSGCGGGGGGGSSTVKNATIGIAWPDRTRALTTDLSSAQSATILIFKGSASKANVSFNVNRNPASLAAHTEDYTIPVPIRKDASAIYVQFFSAADAGGTLVGSATCAVDFTDGSFEPAFVSFTGEANSITAIAPGNLTIGDPATQLMASVKKSDGSTLAVSAGSIKWTQTSGSGNVTVTSDGLATPVAVGPAAVTAEVDGLVSAPIVLNAVQAGPTTNALAIAANHMAYDSVNDRLWITVPDDGTANANKLVAINPATGAVTLAYSVGVKPDLVAVTSDGLFAYVSVPADSTVRRIDLSSGTTVGTYVAGGGLIDLKAIPGSDTSYVVITDPTGGVNMSVWDNGIRRTGTGAGGYAINFSNDPSIIYGDGHGSLFTNVVTSTSISFTHQDNMNVAFFAYSKTDSMIYSSSGTVYDPTTGLATSSFSTAHVTFDRGLTLSDADNRFYMVTWNSGDKHILTFNLATKAELLDYNTGIARGGVLNLTACGNKTVAFNLYGDGARTVVLVNNLP